jgi:fructoselysine 6-kinase
VERFAATMAHLAIGFVGWPGDPHDPVVREIGAIAAQHDRLLVITLGSRGVIVVEGTRGATLHPVRAVPVAGTTVGCGDAFIAAFLRAHLTGAPLAAALDAARAAGAAATAWTRPLPDDAYGPRTG